MFLWFAAMAGLIFFMVTIVDVFRGNRGDKQIEEAYALLDQGEISLGIERLEEAEETYQRIGQRFPEVDTLFGLYLRVQEFGKAQRKLNQMYRYKNRDEWVASSVRFIRSAREEDFDRAMYVAEDLVDRDYTLTEYVYPSDVDSILGIALAEKLTGNGYYEGFYRQEEWSDEEVEWWYYVADDGENIEIGNFHRTAGKAFGGKKKVFIDLFEIVPGQQVEDEHMGFSGRVVFQGEQLMDSTMIAPQTVAYDSLDAHSRWAWYVNDNNWEMFLFSWNTALMTAPIEEPYYKNQFYLRLRERTNWFNKDALMDLARMRALQIQDNDGIGCRNGDEEECWTLDPVWLDPLPVEYAEIWAEKFKITSKSPKSDSEWTNPRVRSLSSHLKAYVENRKRSQ